MALVVSQALFLVPVGVVAARRGGRAPGRWIAGVVAVWTLTEALRARVPLGGFEWGQLGTTAHGLPLAPAAAAVGTLGVTALLVALAAAGVSASRPVGPMRCWRAPAVVLVVAVIAVAAVQVDPVYPGRYAVDCPGEREDLLVRHLAATGQIDGGIDLLLWGEGSLRGEPDATGQRVTETELYGADLLVTEIGLTSGETPFARWGDLLAVATAGIMLAALAVQRSPRRIHRAVLSG